MRALLACDGSPGAEQAASLVLAIRWPAGSVVRVVGVVDPSSVLYPAAPLAPGRLVTAPEIESQIVEYTQGVVDSVTGRLTAAQIDAEGVVVHGRPATVLIEEAQQFGADLIVAGSRGHGRIASLVLGSVSAEVVDHAPCPVLVARHQRATRVLFASDGSRSAAQAEEILARWPIFDAATIRVVSVAEVIGPWHTGVAPTMYRAAMEAYAQDLETATTNQKVVAGDALRRLETAGRTGDANVRVGDAAAEVIEEASSWEADLIVLGSRGLTGLERIILGSVARNVLHGTKTSVLVVKDRATPAEAT